MQALDPRTVDDAASVEDAGSDELPTFQPEALREAEYIV